MSGFARRRMPVWIAIALVATSLVTALPAAAASPSGADVVETARESGTRGTAPAGSSFPPTCVDIGGQAGADDLMINKYTFPPHRTVTLPASLTWAEDPLHDANWRFQFHSMGWMLTLVFAWKNTGDKAYRKRAVLLAKSWINKNPKSHPPSDMSWNDHSTALRTIAFSCLARMLPTRQDWLQNAIAVHGATLADPNFYVYSSNHALNQNIGLLEAGCWLDRSYWEHLAADRITNLLPRSINSQGASNEASVYYEWYNFRRYNLAKDRLVACGQDVTSSFARVDKMPRFLAFATLPNGEYLNIGDGREQLAGSIPGTIAEFAATQGASGPKPDNTIAVYDAGFVFGRTGWGDTRPFADEIDVLDQVRLVGRHPRASRRRGRDVLRRRQRAAGRPRHQGLRPGPVAPLLRVPGRAQRGCAARPHGKEHLQHDPGPQQGLQARLRRQPEHRRVFRRDPPAARGLLRRLGFMVVDDSMSSSRSEQAIQLWHAPIGRHVKRNGADTWTRGDGGDVLIRQLINTGTTYVVKGTTNPIQGWLPNGWGKVAQAPVVEQSGTRLVPAIPHPARPVQHNLPEVSVTDLTTGKNAFSFTITIGKASQHVEATPTGVKITDL